MPSNVGRQPIPRVSPQHTGIGVALVDGVPLFRDGLCALVARARGLFWIGAADSATAAVQMCERLRPDVVLLDSGIDPRNQLIQMLVELDQRLGVLLVVRDQHRTTQYIAGALTAGVHGVVPRSIEPYRAVEAIRAVHVERRYVDAALAPVIAAPRVKLDNGGLGKVQPLSRREFQVLQLIADGLENQAIAKILYVSVETVRTHVKSILRKLGARDRTHAVAVAFRGGVLPIAADLSGPPAADASGEPSPRTARG